MKKLILPKINFAFLLVYVLFLSVYVCDIIRIGKCPIVKTQPHFVKHLVTLLAIYVSIMRLINFINI